MEGPRAPAPQELNEILKFLDQSLRPNSEWSISAEYPTALGPHNLHNIRIIKDGSEVLSHAVLKPLVVKTPVAIFKVAAIGSVVTNSNFRNQGLSRQIIQACVDEAQKQDCDFAVLWTNLYDFYRKAGFELAGQEVSIFIDNPIELIGFPTLTFRQGSNIDPALVHRLYSRHTVSSVRTIEEIRQFLRVPNSRVYSAWDSNGQLVAYAVEGKGADLDGYIHEWGGGSQELIALFNHMVTVQKRPLTVISPAHAVSLISRLSDAGCILHEGYLGMIKLLHTTNLFGKITRHVKNDFGISSFVLEQQGEEYVIGTQQSLYKTKSEQDVVKLLFGPQRPSEIFPFNPQAKEILDRIFPLRLWFWGWDSI